MTFISWRFIFLLLGIVFNIESQLSFRPNFPTLGFQEALKPIIRLIFIKTPTKLFF